MRVLVMPGLTLPEVTENDLDADSSRGGLGRGAGGRGES